MSTLRIDLLKAVNDSGKDSIQDAKIGSYGDFTVEVAVDV